VVEFSMLLDVLAIRDRRIQVERILNGLRAIERRIAFDLLMLFDCKLHRDMDMELILTVSEKRNQEE
jgi:hypothetical protein